MEALFPNNLNQHPLPPLPIILPVKDLLPRAEVELAVRDGDDDLAAHELALEVGVGIVLAGLVVVVLRDGRMWRERFKPPFEIAVQAMLVVVDETGGGDVHRIDEHHSLFHAALVNCLLHLA